MISKRRTIMKNRKKIVIKDFTDEKTKDFLSALNNKQQRSNLVLTEAQARELKELDKKPQEPLIEM